MRWLPLLLLNSKLLRTRWHQTKIAWSIQSKWTMRHWMEIIGSLITLKRPMSWQYKLISWIHWVIWKMSNRGHQIYQLQKNSCLLLLISNLIVQRRIWVNHLQASSILERKPLVNYKKSRFKKWPKSKSHLKYKIYNHQTTHLSLL